MVSCLLMWLLRKFDREFYFWGVIKFVSWHLHETAGKSTYRQCQDISCEQRIQFFKLSSSGFTSQCSCIHASVVKQGL